MTNRNRVHYSTEKPGQTGKARARCGVWSSAFTADQALVTCLACRNLTRTIAKTVSLVLSFALMLAACGPLPPDDQASGTDTPGTTYVTSGAEGTTTPCSTGTGTPDTTGTTGPAESTTGTTGGTSEDAAATGTEATDTSTGTPDEATGETGESQTTGACAEPACIAADCDVGQECRPHPGTGVPVCVSPCEIVGAGLCEAMVCGEPVLGSCVVNTLGAAWCFPGVTGS